MEVLKEGKGELLGWHDPDEARDWVLENKSRELKDKTMSVKEAVSRFVDDGDFIASGGFGHVRVSMAIVYEIIRRKKRNLAMAGKTAVHDIDILVGSGCVNRAEVAYCFGHELRGLSPASRRMVESGQCKVVAETSNAGYQWRFLAGMMGIPFIPSRNLLGTDTGSYSSCKVVMDPFSGKPINLIPAAYPDVAFIHVHRCDIYGNAQIDAILVEDFELSRCARRLIITTEEIIDNEIIRKEPWKTAIPFLVVDAVVKVPYGSHPCEMPGMYYYDEDHIAEWLKLSRCARRLIITTEEIIDNEIIRKEPWKTAIPFLVVDAVVKVPYGSHPCEMPGMYYYDEDHIAEWLNLSRTPDGVDEYLNKFVFGVDSFDDYLELCGGTTKLNYLKRREFLKEPMVAPWRK